jgi:OOP family OmpA-OmpF porin
MQSGLQFGVGAGGSELDLSIPDTSGSTSLGDATYTAFAGYRINRWAAVEASYLYGGSFGKNTSEVFFKTEPRIATATGMGILPITQDFSLFGRAGLAHWWYTADFGVAGVGTASFSEKSNEVIWGAGMSLFVDRGLLRLEYAQSKTSPDFAGTTFDFKLRMLTLSVAWTL